MKSFLLATLLRRPGTARRDRRGLAPLELVLSLPLLLFVMALIVNVGTSAAWKVRALGASRDAVWRDRWPRSGEKPNPAGWPDSASISSEFDENIDELDHWKIDKPVARGPHVGEIKVNEELLNPSRGVRVGTSSIQRKRPLLPAVGGPMNYEIDQSLIEDSFTYQKMTLNTNVRRRIKLLYDFDEDASFQFQNYVSAVNDVNQAINTSNLLPLTYYQSAWCVHPGYGEDGTGPPPEEEFSSCSYHYDPDFQRLRYAWYGGRLDPPWGRFVNFHPKLGGFCHTNASEVNQLRATLINKINDAPKYVAETYKSFYERAISIVENHLQALQSQDPLPIQQIAQVQAILDARRAELEPKIEELTDFIGGL